MPALRSLYAITFLTACLAQAKAGPSPNEAVRRDGYGGGGQGYGGQGGNNYGGGGSGGNEWQNVPDFQGNQGQQMVTVTVTQYQTVTAPAPAQNNAPPMTVTVTAVAPCNNNVVTATAYVTTCPAMPAPASGSSCMPCEGMMSWPLPPNGGGLGNCPVVTTSIPGFMPGLSSIPASQAVVTGMAAAAASPAAAPAGAPGPGYPAPAGAPSGAAAPAYTYGAPNSPASSAAVTETSPSTLAAVSPGVFASDAASASDAKSGTTTATSTITSSPNQKEAVTSKTDVPAAAKASTGVLSVISYSNSGLLGMGKRYAVPTAWS